MYRKDLLLLLAVLLFATQSVFSQPVDSDTLKKVQQDSDTEYYERLMSGELDKMLDLWYVKREVAKKNSVLSKLKDEPGGMEETDSLLAERVKKISTIIPLAYNSKVRSWIELYVNKRKRSSAAILGLAQYYYPWMQQIFDKYNVPEELIYMTIIESSLNPTAVSHAGATGIWQFMYTTGKMYGLEVNTFIDDRRDPVKATDAAARHLRDLYNMFNDWGLAIAAYNCGPGNVRKAIQRSGGKSDFWGVQPYLPKETQNYFPAYIGAYYMMKYHNVYGITPASISIPTSVDTVMINKELHFEQIAHVLNIDINEIKILNPQYKRDVIPAYTEAYPLKLRNQDLIRYLELKDSVHAYNYESYFTPLKVYENVFTGKSVPSTSMKKKYHVVKSGETLSKIAVKYGLSLAELKKMNKLKSNYVNPKTRLVVGYEPVAPAQTSSQQATQTTQATPAKAPVKSTDITSANDEIYVVKKGDTFYAIAAKFKLNARTLADYNGIKNMNQLEVGQKIKIPKKK